LVGYILIHNDDGSGFVAASDFFNSPLIGCAHSAASILTEIIARPIASLRGPDPLFEVAHVHHELAGIVK
jgi:hypothetical protein